MALVPISTADGSIALGGLVDEVKTFAEAAKAASTRRAYASDLANFRRFASSHGLVDFPSTPQTVALYVANAARITRYSTIARRLVAISQAHKARGLESPASHPIVREAMKGIARTLGTATTQKAALSTAALRTIVTGLDATIHGHRDRALLLVGFAGATRRSEIVAISVDDVRFEQEGAVILIRRSKTDQEGAGHELAIPNGRHSETCPVVALQTWILAAKIAHGPIFRAVDKTGRISSRALSTESVSQIIKRHVRSLGYDAAAYAGHSLRAGFATAAILAGASEHAMMRQTRHRSVDVARRYVRHASIWHDHAGRAVDL